MCIVIMPPPGLTLLAARPHAAPSSDMEKPQRAPCTANRHTTSGLEVPYQHRRPSHMSDERREKTCTGDAVCLLCCCRPERRRHLLMIPPAVRDERRVSCCG